MEEEYKWARFPFFVKGSHQTSVYVGHNTDTNYTKLQVGKYCKIVRDKQITDPTLWPFNLQCNIDEVTINAEVTYDSSKKQYSLKINDQPYAEIPYRTDFEPEPEVMIDTREKLDAHLTLNNEVIQFGCKPWDQDAL